MKTILLAALAAAISVALLAGREDMRRFREMYRMSARR
jgi:hypothetical protein